ncbi:unnamed protein product [Haemonchus placei]|uniref:Uncharacterized protein n=1 Tax=Haemonchus placei TaxID=6290 RepID=A0A0N4WJZ2_HAEPC|nr:unnamed protein product [Haemonchus placei]
MQNELLDPPLSQGVMQHVTLPPQPMSGPLSQPPTSSIAESEQTDPNRARKVAEVFLTAGHAFQKLGDLAMQLHMGPSSVPNEERWSENNVDHLREALTRFAHELDQISNNVQARTTKMISTDIRRRHMAPQRPVASAISTLKRQPTRLGPVIVPKRLNVTRSATRPQYVQPGRLATAPPAISQVIVPTTKTYPMTRTTSSTFAGQRHAYLFFVVGRRCRKLECRTMNLFYSGFCIRLSLDIDVDGLLCRVLMGPMHFRLRSTCIRPGPVTDIASVQTYFLENSISSWC